MLLTLFVVVGLSLRLPLLFRGLWFDEAFRTFLVLNPTSIRELLLHDVHNPLYNAFMYGWIRVFGDSEPSIRVPTLLAGVGVIWIAWLWCRSRWGERAAWWSAAWLVVNSVHAYYSCEAKNNMFTVFFATLALWRWDVMARTLSKRDGALAVLAGALAIWTDFQALLVLPAIWIAWIVFLARDQERSRAWVAPVYCVIGTLVLASPLLLFKAAHLDDLDRNYLRYFHIHEPLRLLLVYFPSGNGLFVATRSTWPIAAVLFAPLVLPALLSGWFKVRKVPAGRVMLISFLAPMAITLIGSEIVKLFNQHIHIYQERNLLVMLPGLAIVLGVGMSLQPSKKLISLSQWGLLLLGLVSLLAIMTWNKDRETIMRLGRADWRAAAAICQDGTNDRPKLVLSRTPLLPMRYYMPNDQVIELQRAEANAPAEAVVAEIKNLLAQNQAEGCWVIHSDYWAPLTQIEIAAIQREFKVGEAQYVRGLVIWRVRAK